MAVHRETHMNGAWNVKGGDYDFLFDPYILMFNPLRWEVIPSVTPVLRKIVDAEVVLSSLLISTKHADLPCVPSSSSKDSSSPSSDVSPMNHVLDVLLGFWAWYYGSTISCYELLVRVTSILPSPLLHPTRRIILQGWLVDHGFMEDMFVGKRWRLSVFHCTRNSILEKFALDT